MWDMYDISYMYEDEFVNAERDFRNSPDSTSLEAGVGHV